VKARKFLVTFFARNCSEIKNDVVKISYLKLKNKHYKYYNCSVGGKTVPIGLGPHPFKASVLLTK
jgi:hypothetical protein